MSQTHAEERGPQQVAALGEQAVERGAVVLQAARLIAHRETHAAFLRGDAEFREQRDEVRVGAVVEDDEAGVDLVAAAGLLNAVRVGVAADVAGRFVYGNVVFAVQPVRDDIARDAAADDGDLHRGASQRCGTFWTSDMS